jgi:hypothetical protein
LHRGGVLIMEITFLDQTMQITNTSLDVDKLFENMTSLLDEQKLHISHMMIDGQHIYENYKSYIQDRINTVQQVQVSVVTMKQYVNQLVVSSREYCGQAIQQAPELAVQFYQQPNQDTWQQFEQLLEGADWLTQFIQLIVKTNVGYSNTDAYGSIGDSINRALPELLESVKLEQFTAIGDILQYEILPQYELLLQELQKTIEGEGI